MVKIRQTRGRTWANSVANTVFALDKRYNAQNSEYPYLKHAPFVYNADACAAVADEFRAEFRATMEEHFRSSQDVIFPLIHHAYMRAEGATKLDIDLTIAPPEEMDKFVLLSLSGDEPPDSAHPERKTAAQTHA